MVLPVTIGTAKAAGSKGLCPPTFTNDPPTNATSAKANHNNNSPILSPKKTLTSGVIACFWLRRAMLKPCLTIKSATLSKRSG